MSYISFNKSQLVNLEFALKRELLRSNRSGGYSSTTISGCNTRKYHGLLVVPQPWLDHNNHVLLSAIDESIVQHDEQFNFGVRMYPNGKYEPKGHKYLREFVAEPIPKLIYRVGGVVLSKEMIFAENESRILIKYTLLEATSETKLKLKPFLAFRNVHQLTRSNLNANTKYEPTRNGVSWQMYGGYSRLFVQLSKDVDYTHVPDWYYNVEYIREKERGFPFQEDLFVPGFFEMTIKKGESIIVSAGLEEKDPASFKRQFNKEINKRIPRNNFENCLINSAEQFIVKNGSRTEIMAGFPWFGTWGRDTFIALPGITLVKKDETTFKAVIDTMISTMKGPLFPNIGQNNQPDYAAVDSPLWLFWSLQQYHRIAGKDLAAIWKAYKKVLISIIDNFVHGADYNIKMLDNGLLYAGGTGLALTWMDVVSHGKPVTPRSGLAVEVNALWYNAIKFSLQMAEAAGDRKFVKQWRTLPEMIQTAFTEVFWSEKHGYLADCVNGETKDFSVRPNMLFAVSLTSDLISEEKQMQVMQVVKSELLTERGLRTLSPKNPNYKGVMEGDQKQRDMAYHQGTVFPWLIDHFAEGWLRLYGKGSLSFIEYIYENFESEMLEAGIGSISEVYDGDPPHEAKGAISQAWSVSALLRLNYLITRAKL